MHRSTTSTTLRNLLLALTCVVATACGGSSTGGTGSGVTGKPGGQCSTEGAKVPAADGCNTCTCTNGSYACTEMACLTHDGGSGPACTTEGATTIAADGCNVCTCRSGNSVCTHLMCPDDAGSDLRPCSTPGATELDVDGCNTCTCSAKHRLMCSAGRICPECTPGQTMAEIDMCGNPNSCSCSASGQWQCPYPDNCPPPPACTPGQTKQQDCNTCSCLDGQWACTYLACNACTEGDTKTLDCNTCLCTGGQWACTKKACLPLDAGVPIDAGPAPKVCGARAGDTCAANEYCAYAEGALCGAADAEATCAPRPTACHTIYSPVCGCDGKDYTNSCSAAAAGTGVRSSGTCPTGAF